MGAEQLVPLDRASGDTLLVDRGWVPNDDLPRIPAGTVTLDGYVRPPEPSNWLSARDNPATRRFYALDPAAIGRALGLSLAPYTIVALGPPDVLPIPAAHLPRPPNNHLSYALTWFGFAVILAVIFILWARKTLRNMNPAYARLRDNFARIATIGEALSMLGWDAATVMPPGGAAARGDQLAVLSGLQHGLMTAPAMADDLASAEAAPADPDPWRAANLRLMRHAHTRATALPADLVEARARANSACEKIWRDARRLADFSLVQAHLAEVINLTRQAAAALAPALGLTPYDALMDGFQRGIGAADVQPVFDDYQTFLHDALPQAEERQARQEAPIMPHGPFPAEVQETLCRMLSARAGLDFEHARLDRSAHPFCGGTPHRCADHHPVSRG